MPKSLVEFRNAQRIKVCKICNLPKEIRAQMKTAKENRIHRSVVLAWLKQEHGFKFVDAELLAHIKGHHG